MLNVREGSGTTAVLGLAPSVGEEDVGSVFELVSSTTVVLGSSPEVDVGSVFELSCTIDEILLGSVSVVGEANAG